MNYFDENAWHTSPPILSQQALDWFTDKGSLTKRLREYTNNQIEHHLFFNDWDDEKNNWLRKMEWRYDNQTWMNCVVTIPKDSLLDELKEAGKRSIGEILFSEPTLRRSDFLYQEKNHYYSRHSIFYFKEKPFTLIETFFPAFFEAIAK